MTIKRLSELKKDLEAMRDLVETSNPDANMGQNRFYTFLTDLLVNLDAYVIEPPVVTGRAFNSRQFDKSFK